MSRLPNRQFARQLRSNQTDTERFVWAKLRSRRFAGFKFRRQTPLGKYTVDFVCFQKRLDIELDGGQHLQQAAYDEERTAWLESQGFRVIRFWDHQVFDEWDAIEEVIWNSLQDDCST
jgi:very-short-patch-repair endonuclease